MIVIKGACRCGCGRVCAVREAACLVAVDEHTAWQD